MVLWRLVRSAFAHNSQLLSVVYYENVTKSSTKNCGEVVIGQNTTQISCTEVMRL